jgi:hypothetical protein
MHPLRFFLIKERLNRAFYEIECINDAETMRS